MARAARPGDRSSGADDKVSAGETKRTLENTVDDPLASASHSAKPRLEMLCHTAEPG
jgi:hypothetical protein